MIDAAYLQLLTLQKACVASRSLVEVVDLHGETK